MNIINNANNEDNNFEFLDIITIVGFIAQLSNIAKDEEQTNYIHKVIETIAQEIEKLHQENDYIMWQNEEILKILKNR